MLQVAIAGAGVSGLVAAYGFARYGHKVDVYERKTEEIFQNEGGAGVQLQSNAVNVLKAWGIDLKGSVIEGNRVFVRKWDTGELLGAIGPVIGVQWNIIRSDFRRLMLKRAIDLGVKVHFNQDITGVDESQPALLLADGTQVKADLIIGADGARSKIRQFLYPNYKPKLLNQGAFQIFLEASQLQGKHALDLVNASSFSIMLGERCGVVLGPVPSRTSLDAQFLVEDCRLPSDDGGDFFFDNVPDITFLRDMMKKFGGAIPEILERAKGAWRWRFTEVQAQNWSSRNGRIICLGDAVHAMPPWSGQGAGMCIEDAATIAEFFRDVAPSDREAFRNRAELYQTLRKPRTDKVQERARGMGQSWLVPDGPIMRKRDAAYRGAMENKLKLAPQGDPDAKVLSNAFDNWLEQYDMIGEVSASPIPEIQWLTVVHRLNRHSDTQRATHVPDYEINSPV
jgi:salicylate hydroxylase